jgi:hypothetical protein
MIASRIAVEEYVHSSRNRQFLCYALLIKTWTDGFLYIMTIVYVGIAEGKFACLTTAIQQ